MKLTINTRDLIVAGVAIVVGAAIGTGIGVLVTGQALPGEIIGALVSLALAIIGGVGAVVKLLIDRISAELQHNTAITTRVEQQTNGQLAHERETAQKYRTLYESMVPVFQELSRTPEGRRLIDEALEARRTVVRDEDFTNLEKRLQS